MNRPIFAYEVDIQLTGIHDADSHIVTSFQHAYSVVDAMMQASLEANDMTKYSAMKVLRIGPPRADIVLQDKELQREIERQSRHAMTLTDAVAKDANGQPVNLERAE